MKRHNLMVGGSAFRDNGTAGLRLRTGSNRTYSGQVRSLNVRPCSPGGTRPLHNATRHRGPYRCSTRPERPRSARGGAAGRLGVAIGRARTVACRTGAGWRLPPFNYRLHRRSPGEAALVTQDDALLDRDLGGHRRVRTHFPITLLFVQRPVRM
jgi:hypothetical protein